jgi:glycosyltransferase involved in cell wall biosynthesis
MINSICFVIPELIFRETGGAELQVSFIANELIRKGWNVEIVTIKRKSKDYFHRPAVTGDVKYFFYSKHKAFRTLEFITVFLCLLKTRAHVYYQRTTSAHTGAVALFCRFFRKKMLFAVASNNDLTRFFNSRNFQADAYKNKIKALIRKTDLFFVDCLIQKGLKYSDVIICQTKDQQDKIGDDLKNKSVLIRNSFPISIPTVFTKENIIIWVGNLRKIKRPELFMRLAKEVHPEGWEYYIIGEIRENQYDIIRQKNDNFIYIGSLPFNETLIWFEKAKILVNTSESEGFTNTFIQAWLYRVFVMSLSVDPDKLLTHFEYGFCANSDFNLLKTTLTEVCKNYESYNPIISKANKFAKSEFDINKNLESLEEIFH